MGKVVDSRSDLERGRCRDPIAPPIIPCRVIIEEHEFLAGLYQSLPCDCRKVMTAMGIEYYQESAEKFLIWLQWSRRYRISFPLVVRIVVQNYRRVLGKEGNTLGVNLATLTGEEAERIVAAESVYWRSKNPHNPAVYRLRYDSVEQYNREMLARRKRNRLGCVGTKPYRGGAGWKFGIVAGVY